MGNPEVLKAPTHIGKDKIKQDKNIYQDLIQDIKRQLQQHDRAAASRRGGLTPTGNLEDKGEAVALANQLHVHSCSPASTSQEFESGVLSLHSFRGVDKVVETRELLENVLSMIGAMDILKMRLVNGFWRDTVRGMARIPAFRQIFFFEPLVVGPVERGTIMPTEYVNPRCTAKSIWHTECRPCYNVKLRERAVSNNGPPGIINGGPFRTPPGLNVPRHQQLRPVITGAYGKYRHRAKHWLDFEQFTINSMLQNVFGDVYLREGRIDFDLKELLDGTFTFANMRQAVTLEVGALWEQTFLTQPPRQSISIMMIDRHVGRKEIATCDDNMGIRLCQVLDELENVAVTVANHSRNSIEESLLAQPSVYTIPDEEIDIEERWEPGLDRSSWVEKRAEEVDPRDQSHYRRWSTDPVKIREQYNDWKWRFGVVPPSKMEIALVLKCRGASLGDLSEHDLLAGLIPILRTSHFHLWSGIIKNQLLGGRKELRTEADNDYMVDYVLGGAS